MNKRLLKEPDYNKKRRKGSGIEHLETCQCCHLPIPTLLMRDEGAAMPCSEYHVRCVRCLWPVERRHISPVGTCVMCMSASDRRRYYRRYDGAHRAEVEKIRGIENETLMRDEMLVRDEYENVNGDGDDNTTAIIGTPREPQHGKFGTVQPSIQHDRATKRATTRQRILFKQYATPRHNNTALATNDYAMTTLRQHTQPREMAVTIHENGTVMEVPT